MGKRLLLLLSALFLAGPFLLGEVRLEKAVHPELKIFHVPVEVLNNSSRTYQFSLSVLGLQEEREFVPFLAIAIDETRLGAGDWMAIWNLSEGGTNLGAQVKALIPSLWGTMGGAQDKKGVGDNQKEGPDLPKPYLTWNAKKSRSWTEFRWSAAKIGSNLAGLFNPARFLFNNYTHFRDDTAERRFYQIYTLLRLYEEVQAVEPSATRLSSAALIDLKFSLIVSRSSFGIFARGEDPVSVVSRFESALRETIGLISCYVHDAANQLYLRIEEVPYGLPGRPAVGRAGYLSIQKSDLPSDLPEWPANNIFDLASSPYTDPKIREALDRNPDEPIPLAIYVFGSELRMKPVLVVDYFNPGNPRKRQATGVLKVALDNFLSLRGIPWFGRVIKGTVDYGLDKKDASYFNYSSGALGLEATRIFARMGWNFDPDINHLLIHSMEDRIGNPLVASSSRERRNLNRNFAGLLSGGGEKLGLFLRTLYENRVRRDLNLGNKAIFQEDLEEHASMREYESALRTIRSFNRQTHLPATSWDVLIDAWNLLESYRCDCPEREFELKRLAGRMTLLYPEGVPASHRAAVHRLLDLEFQVAQVPAERLPGSGFVSD